MKDIIGGICAFFGFILPLLVFCVWFPYILYIKGGFLGLLALAWFIAFVIGGLYIAGVFDD